MNTQTLDELSAQVSGLQATVEALADPEKLRGFVTDAMAAGATGVQVDHVQGTVTALKEPAPAPEVNPLEQGVAAFMLKSAKNRAAKTVKSGHYVYQPTEYGNVRITGTGAVYIADKTGWRRIKGQAAKDVKAMVEQEQAAQRLKE